MMVDNLMFENDGLYIVRDDGDIYPQSHPDISTQPSLLPQRFGNLKVMEVLIPYNTNKKLILKRKSFVLNAFAFNETHCAPVSIKKSNNTWCVDKIHSEEQFDPLFVLVLYVEDQEDVLSGIRL